MLSITKKNDKRIEMLMSAYLPLVKSGKLTASEALEQIQSVLGLNFKILDLSKILALTVELVKAELTTKKAK
jgi:hypothetical protein